MTPSVPSTVTPARRLARVRAVAVVAALALVVAACGGPGATFDPTGPCVVDGQVAGAYPDLEDMVPRTLDGKTPTTVDSGRTCTDLGLGTLKTHGLASVTFAGSTWDLGSGSGVSSAVFTAEPSLEAAWLAEFYEAGAREAKKVSNVETSRPALDGAGTAFRLDALNDLSLQSILTWQDGELVRVVLVATTVRPDASREAHDELVAAVVRATVEFASAGG